MHRWLSRRIRNSVRPLRARPTRIAVATFVLACGPCLLRITLVETVASAATTCGAVEPANATVPSGQNSQWYVQLTPSCNGWTGAPYDLSVCWDFGDGSDQVIGNPGDLFCGATDRDGSSMVNKTYSQPGQYELTAYVVSDVDGSLVPVDRTGVSVVGVGNPSISALGTGSAGPCSFTTQTPHLSLTANLTQIITNANMTCTSSAIPEVKMNIFLYRCPQQPIGPEDSWSRQGCAQIASRPWAVTAPIPGRGYASSDTLGSTPSVPYAAGQPPAWYVACTVYAYENDADYYNLWQGTQPSSPAEI